MFGSLLLELDLILDFGLLAEITRGVALRGVLLEVALMLLC